MGCQRSFNPTLDERNLSKTDQSAVYKLGSGDRLRISVYNEEGISGEYEISGSGSISLKLIGSIAANGLTIEELARNIETKLRDGYLKDPHVSIDVLNYRPFYVLGEVKQPGKYPYVNGMTVLNAIALSGGYTYRARENSVIIVRGNDRDQKERLVDENNTVLPGDVIRVPERYFWKNKFIKSLLLTGIKGFRDEVS